jgi:acetylornithine deacetylase/succinyl-diaminopimelate desuccinylase-like protein
MITVNPLGCVAMKLPLPTALLLTMLALPSWAQIDKPLDSSAEARALLAAVVSFDTASGHGQVPKMAAYLAAQFMAAGFDSSDINLLPLGDTASLVVRYHGDGRGGKPIAFMAHMDVVQANRSEWHRDPFTLVEEQGYFFGRGTLDMKEDVALLSQTFIRLKRSHFLPSRDLILVFTGDEESSQDTAIDLVNHHRDLIDADYALNGDMGSGVLDASSGKPLLFYIQGAEKSVASFTLTARNPGGHSSQPRPDNAIYELASALTAISHYQFPTQTNSWTLSDFKAASTVTPGPLGQAMARFAKHPNDQAAAAQIAQSPPYVGKLKTTCVATQISGGHAENALPQTASAIINCRIFPGTSAETVQSRLQALAGPHITITSNYPPTYSDPSPLRPDVVAAVQKAVDAANPGAVVAPTMVAYATDGSVFRKAGIPTYGVGSMFIKDAENYSHGLNERIPVERFYNGLIYWDVIIHTLATDSH